MEHSFQKNNKTERKKERNQTYSTITMLRARTESRLDNSVSLEHVIPLEVEHSFQRKKENKQTCNKNEDTCLQFS